VRRAEMSAEKNQILGKDKYGLDTPCLLIDIDVLHKNIRAMQESVRGKGKNLRPHAKTHKCSVIAQKQLDAGAVGICTAKLSEAEALVKGGIERILITGPVVLPLKEERLAALIQRCGELILVLDNLEQARLLSTLCEEQGLSVHVLLDIDPGLRRTGVSAEEAPDFARKIMDLAGLNLRGIQAYAGQVQHIASYEERRQRSMEYMHSAEEVFRKLVDEGMELDIFTGAGTGTFDIDTDLEGLTDLQVGSYVFMDAEYRAIGSALEKEAFTLFEPALTMLAAVVSSNQSGFVTVDAGLKSMYRHGGTPIIIYPRDALYSYDWFGDEYGKISFAEKSKSIPPGSMFELVVSHCDPTVNLFDRFYVTKDDRVVDMWNIDLRGKSS
jgi:D-serine deaminase-like pyridoxal phosphate-dependent protein